MQEGAAGAAEDPFGAREFVILVVDDEEDIRTAIKKLLERALPGSRVIAAESGEAALAVLKRERIDLVISDYKMPGMNGLDFLNEAKKLAPGTPRILVTAFPDIDLALRAINEARIENFFTKPVEPLAVIDVATKLLYERRSQDLRNRAFARTLSLLRKDEPKA